MWFYGTSKCHRIWSKSQRAMIGTVLESWRSILSKNINCINKFLVFDTYLEPERYTLKIPENFGWDFKIPFRFQKYLNSKIKVGDRQNGIWAFQNRSQNVSTTSRSIFRIPLRSYSFEQNSLKSRFWSKLTKVQQIIKIDLRVATTFWDRFWKA